MPIDHKNEVVLDILRRTEIQAKRMSASANYLSINEEDLFSDGQAAVLHALDVFDPEKTDVGVEVYCLTASKRAMLNRLKMEKRRKSKETSLFKTLPSGEEMTLPDKKLAEPCAIVEADETFPRLDMRAQKGKKLTLTEVRASTPSALQTAMQAEELKGVLMASICPTDIMEIMEVVKKKAREGNIAAARLVFDQVNQKGTSVKVVNTVVNDPR